MMRTFKIAAFALVATIAGLLVSNEAQALLEKHNCTYCHSLHGGPTPGGSTQFVPENSPTNIEVLCLGCHITPQTADLLPESPTNPLTVTAVQPHRFLHTDSTPDNLYITCVDCHAIHDNLPNWRGAHDDVVSQTYPTGWIEGYNTKMVGREDPDGITSNAIIITKEIDRDKNDWPDRGAVVPVNCDPTLVNDCYMTGKRYVIFENRCPSTQESANDGVGWCLDGSGTNIHAFADDNADTIDVLDAVVDGGLGPDDPIGLASNISDSGFNMSPWDSICQMCHSETNNHNLPNGSGTTHNTGLRCTKCHTHEGCFDKGGNCTPVAALSTRDLQVDSVIADSASVLAGDTVTITVEVSNLGNRYESVYVQYSSDIEGFLGRSRVEIGAGGLLVPTSLDWVTTTAGSPHTITAEIDPVIGETGIAIENNFGTDTVTVTSGAAPELTLVKTATPSTYSAVDEVIDYSFLVTNSGTVALAGPVSIADDMATDESCPAGGLAPGADMTCTASYNITQVDLDAGSVTNIATASANSTTSPSDSETVSAIQTKTITMVKTALPPQYSAVDDVIFYSFLVTNTGNVTLTGPGTIADNKAIDEDCPAGDLAPGANKTCTASYTITTDDITAESVTNIATATIDGVTSPSDTATVNVIPPPALTLVKTASPLTYSAVDEVISYTYLVTNTGNVTLAGPGTIADDKATDESCPAGDLAPDANKTCTASYTITQADLDSGSVTNLATATVDGTTSLSDTETVTAVQTPALTMVKTASPLTYSAVDEVISYTYLVTNTGNVTLAGPGNIADDKVTDENCPAGDLVPDANKTCTASYTITQADLDSSLVTNIATATVDGTTSPIDSETVLAIQTKTITMVKTASPLTYSAVDEVISYTYLVTNTGNVTLAGPGTIDDNKATDENCPAGDLAPGANKTCTASYTISQVDLDSGSVTNLATATVDSTDSNLDTVTVNKTVGEVHDVAVLNVTADPNPAGPTTGGGDPITFTVTVKNLGNVPETINVTVDSDLEGGTVCSITGVSLGAGVTSTTEFQCIWTVKSNQDAGSHTITATAATVPGETDTADNSYTSLTQLIINP